jgi:prophage regulatory protein
MRRILKLPEVSRVTGDPPSTVYWRASLGQFTRPIKLGPRSSGWPDDEVEQINAARIAGKSSDEIRALVEKLHAARKVSA